MSRFFIDRPKLAWVVAIFILLAGLLAIPALPLRYVLCNKGDSHD